MKPTISYFIDSTAERSDKSSRMLASILHCLPLILRDSTPTLQCRSRSHPNTQKSLTAGKWSNVLSRHHRRPLDQLPTDWRRHLHTLKALLCSVNSDCRVNAKSIRCLSLCENRSKICRCRALGQRDAAKVISLRFCRFLWDYRNFNEKFGSLFGCHACELLSHHLMYMLLYGHLLAR